MNVLTFLYEQPIDVQVYVGQLVEAARSNRGLDVQGEMKKRFGDQYSDEQIERLIWGAQTALR
jgi:hypothetical protein